GTNSGLSMSREGGTTLVTATPVCAGAPAGPCGPTSPCGPAGPCGPTSPCGPAGPCGPTSPCGPAGPVAPARPCAPAGPVAPAGPWGPVWLHGNATSPDLHVAPGESTTRSVPSEWL